MRSTPLSAAGLAIASFLSAGCGASASSIGEQLTGGDPAHGAAVIRYYGCGSCHRIPGISSAAGEVGPNLAGIGSRTYIAGELSNVPGNMERWIQDPHSVNQKTVMPNLGVTQRDATDIAAYLYSQK